MKILKKNQLIILVIALILVTAGYLNYTSNMQNTIPTSIDENSIDLGGIGDARLVNSNNIDEENKNVIVQNDETASEINDGAESRETEDSQEEVITSVKASSNEYFTISRIDRDKMFSQTLESYENILNNENIGNEQKGIATEEIKRINETKNAIMIAENLIKTKGFSDCIIFVNGQSISVIVRKDTLESQDIAQIQNIITRELKAEISNVHISNK